MLLHVSVHFYWMPNIVNFTLLFAGYFCILLNILEICSGMQVRQLKQFDPFRSFMMCQVEVEYCSGSDLDCFSFLRQGPSVYSALCPMHCKDFQYGCDKRQQSQSYVSPGHNYFYSFEIWLFLYSQIVFHKYAPKKYSAEYSRVPSVHLPGSHCSAL